MDLIHRPWAPLMLTVVCRNDFVKMQSQNFL